MIVLTSILPPRDRMSQSYRLGVVLLGLGILLLGIYIIKEGSIEGFQSSPASLDLQTLSIKDNEIRTKFALIQTNKLIKDKTLIPAITNDSFNAIHILFSEVSDYINNTNIVNLYSSANAAQISNLYQIMYTIVYMVDILYTIYLTLPSMIVASNIVIDSNTADFNSINNISVTTETGNLINTILSSIPSPSKLTDMYNTTLSQNIINLVANTTSAQIKIGENSLIQYLKMVELQIQIFKDKIAALTSDTIVINTYNDAILFITQVKYNLDSIKSKLNTIPSSTLAIDISSITNNIDDKNIYYTTIKNELINKLNLVKVKPGSGPEPRSGPEGFQLINKPLEDDIKLRNIIPSLYNKLNESFQSYSNPYNAPSLSLKQAYDFIVVKSSNKNIDMNESFQSYSNPYNVSPNLKQSTDFILRKGNIVDKF